MTWTKLDDKFHTDPKLERLSDFAFRVYVKALNWSVAHLTDGSIELETVFMLSSRRQQRTVKAAITELENEKLWIPEGDHWVINHYAKYQPTREYVEKIRVGNVERQRTWRERNALVTQPRDALVTEPDPTRPDPKSSKKAKHDEMVMAAVAAFGLDPAEMTEPLWNQYHAASRQLTDISADPDDIAVRRSRYRELHPDWECTFPAIVKYWPELDPTRSSECVHKWVEVTGGGRDFVRCDNCYQERN